MPPQDLAQALHRQPFKPFRLVLTDGERYEIRHPELFMLGKRSAVIGLVKPDDPEPLYDTYLLQTPETETVQVSFAL